MGVRTLIYDEHHLKQIQFRDLEPGARIDLQYTLRDTGDNIYGDYFADTFYLSGDQPTLKSQYVLDYPKNLSIQKRAFNTKTEAEPITAADGQREILKWTLCDSPGVIREYHMPPEVDQLAQLQVTTMKSWQEVGRWYWNLQKDRIEPTAAIRAKAEELTKGMTDDASKLRSALSYARLPENLSASVWVEAVDHSRFLRGNQNLLAAADRVQNRRCAEVEILARILRTIASLWTTRDPVVFGRHLA
jgi:hypothetical protein